MSTDIRLFAKPPAIYPKSIKGHYRKLKWIAIVILLLVYYIAPFLRFDRGANAPGQAILIDLPDRRAYFFAIEIWPHQIYYLAGIFILAAVGLFFVSAILGRVWCGYACPQTVWTDLFIWVERVIQGDRNARIKLDKASLSPEKIWKKGLTHLLWLIIGALTAGGWVFYFNDAPSLVRDMASGNLSWNVGIWIVALTLSTYVMAGFAREQVCAHMCPYARFQSAMFDRDTLIISYDRDRGEPRGHYKAGETREGKGDCIDCGNCVTVCPTGIDIRNGLQMECIACGLCVDACNNVMDKIGLPRGLIRYDTENNQIARSQARQMMGVFKDNIRLLRPRTFYYMAILLGTGGIMLYSLLTRPAMDIAIIPDRNPMFVKLSNGNIRNSYTLKIMNMTHYVKDYTVEIQGLQAPDIKIEGAGEIHPQHLQVPADSEAGYRVMLSTSQPGSHHRSNLNFVLKDNLTGETVSHPSLFVSGN